MAPTTTAPTSRPAVAKTVPAPAATPPIGVQWLNERFRRLSPPERIRLFFSSPVLTAPRVLVTSSFGTTSALVLHMLKEAGVDYPIYFLNTSFHFAETLEYRTALTERLGLDVRELRAAPPDVRATLQTGRWSYDPEGCCEVNKVRPLARVKARADIWVSGLMNWQSPTRQDLEVFELRDDLMKFYPLVDFTRAEAEAYYVEHDLPRHPLEAQGYASVGCTHCTLPGTGREGRWAGQTKTECGLHRR